MKDDPTTKQYYNDRVIEMIQASLNNEKEQ